MGVTGLWTVLQPCARPIKIETLNKKRLAVDASIWIYQFLKAVRDKEGNALRNSHIVGFFRRICKLLFIGIKPVFVFDGGAPALKRQTISGRRARREGRREDAARTAGKLLAIQLQRAAEDEAKRRKDAPPLQVEQERGQEQEQGQEQIPENLVYADELLQSQHERTQNRTFRKKDQYHLPDLGMSLSEMGGPNDPRVMSLEELEDYARQFDRGEDINVYDFSKIDFDGYFFQSLPPADRYNILNAARLRSRLRMGYSKEQLDVMFPDRMAFSKFQIERVRERNDLTQRLMNLNGMNDDSPFGGTQRVAGEKGREYVLVKNDGVEGGWALGVVTNKDEGKAHKPIDVDLPIRPAEEFEDVDDDDDFEDVPIEGLNRLPKPKPGLSAQEKDGREYISSELAKRRRKFYNSRQDRPARPRSQKLSPVDQDPDSLFLAEDNEVMEWEDVPTNEVNAVSEEAGDSLEDEQLQQAIALSMQQGDPDVVEEFQEDDPVREVFQQERAKDTNPFAKARGSGLAIARLANQRSSKLAPTGPFEGSDSEDEMDLQAALAESRKSKRATEPRPPPPPQKTVGKPPAPAVKPALKSTNASGFDGPLPFEKLNLGNSLLGKKKMEKIQQDTAGGFEKNDTQEKKTAEPLPPWFSGERDINQELAEQRQREAQEWAGARKEHEAQFQFQSVPRLRKQDTKEVINLDDSQSQSQRGPQLITLDSEDEEEAPAEEFLLQHTPPKMGDLADKIKMEPPQPPTGNQGTISKQNSRSVPFEEEDDDEPVDWSESENEDERRAKWQGTTIGRGDEPRLEREKSSSQEFEDVPMQMEPPFAPEPPKPPSPEFEDVPMHGVTVSVQESSKSPLPESIDLPMPAERPRRPRREPSPAMLEGPDDLEIPIVPHGTVDDNVALQMAGNDSDQFSDPEDEDLFASLAAEAEEHARFAQELNSNTTARINFDEELKQLRAQQKKDKRDADEVTQTMVAECQHLLTLFGLPYVTAPMEAEAQCAELVDLGLVDGIVTDDSDTFLFGGTRVYKNMFNAAKFVECYLSQDLTSEFNLTREKLIAIAQLLGSDYCSGIPGIGPVTALEVLSEFPDLQDFKDWWSGVQDASIPKSADASSPFRRRFRRSQGTKLFLPTMFPDPRVADAYLNPEVDSDPEPFQWGVPDLAALRTYLNSQIGWTWERTDEVLVPVIRDMNRREKEGTQSNITRYFDGGVGAGAFAPRVVGAAGKGRGSRLGAALSRLAEKDGARSAERIEEPTADVEAEVTPAKDATRGKRKARPKVASAPAQQDSSTNEDEQSDELYEAPKKKRRRKMKSTKAAT